ncbi:AAA family ATPase [Rasiella sp. SM2506]|uniref:AAA family ATPase n=1 Tax=Rasiella sp. SM2506 TaxID=3423914 RepID=UPI003D7A49F9
MNSTATIPKRIAIIGGPGTGKSTLISSLEADGYACMREISRDIILEAQKEGVEQLFLTNPILFSQKLLEGRLQQFLDAERYETNYLFYDRGLPDVPIYMDYLGTEYPDYFTETCHKNKYETVFLLTPWEQIYQQDNERYESFEIATKLYTYLKEGYENFGYKTIEIPIGTVEDRKKFILNTLQKIT